MKRIIAVSTFAVLGIVGFTLLLEQGTASFEAQARTAKPTPTPIVCTPPSGKYTYSADGQILPLNGSHTGVVAFAGYMEFTKPGSVKGSDTVNYADTGVEDRTYTGTYTMQADCSAQVTLNFNNGGSGTLSLYLGAGQFRFVQRDKYRVSAGSATRISN